MKLQHEPCEEEQYLIRALAKTTAEITSVERLLNDLLQDKTILPLQKLLDLESLRMELHIHMGESERLNHELQK